VIRRISGASSARALGRPALLLPDGLGAKFQLLRLRRPAHLAEQGCIPLQSPDVSRGIFASGLAVHRRALLAGHPSILPLLPWGPATARGLDAARRPLQPPGLLVNHEGPPVDRRGLGVSALAEVERRKALGEQGRIAGLPVRRILTDGKHPLGGRPVFLAPEAIDSGQVRDDRGRGRHRPRRQDRQPPTSFAIHRLPPCLNPSPWTAWARPRTPCRAHGGGSEAVRLEGGYPRPCRPPGHPLGQSRECGYIQIVVTLNTSSLNVKSFLTFTSHDLGES
jgi:hypothetical protein